MRCYADNVLLKLLPRDSETKSGIALVHLGGPKTREHRRALVLASGRGYFTRLGALVPNEVKEGDVVLVDALCGQNWSGFDLTAPRVNANPELGALDGERGEFRVVRHEECLAVIEA